MKTTDNMQELLQYFPERLRESIAAFGDGLTEIRFRREKPIILIRNSDMFFVDSNSRVTKAFNSECVKVASAEIDSFFYAICKNSVHSFQEDICSGFITLSGGHRVGLCGTAVVRDGKIKNIKNINGFNVRVSRELIGSGEDIYNRIFCSGLKNVLIAGVPASGKTTILRDLCRLLGSRYKVSLIDERSEIAAVYMGVPQNDVGINTDVFDGYSKADGLEIAVRVMSPDIIIFDEAGSQDELGYMEHTMNCGIRICASIHASSIEGIKRRIPFWKSFDHIVILGKLPKQEHRIYRTDEL